MYQQARRVRVEYFRFTCHRLLGTMPKTAAVKSRLFVFKHAQERVLVYRPTSYKVNLLYTDRCPQAHTRHHQLAIDAACKEFQALSKERVILQTNELDICAGQYVNVTDETWNEVVDSVNSLLVVELPQNDMAPPQDITLVRSSTSTTTTRIVKQGMSLSNLSFPATITSCRHRR
jgi:hypothetical protein